VKGSPRTFAEWIGRPIETRVASITEIDLSVRGRLAETDCIVATPSAMAPSAGKPIFVRILAESVHLFDAESGTRIDAAN